MIRVADSFAHSDIGRRRTTNEDSLYARAPLFAVADGMGGAQAGEVASGTAVEVLASGLGDGGSAEERLAAVVRAANERIHALSREDERRSGMGTTFTAVLVGEDELTFAHVGDSRAYRFRDGRLEQLTDDHSLVAELVRQGKITPEEAADHPQRSVILRALGPEADVEVDTLTHRARAGDVLLLCSDGLTGMVPEERITAILGSSASLEEAGRQLIDAANEAGGVDNISVVLLLLDEVEVGGAGRPTEQATVAGDDALRAGDVRAALDEQRRTQSTLATVERAPSAPATAPRRRLEPMGPDPPSRAPSADAGRRSRRRWIVAGLIALVLVPVALGLYAAVRAVYFVGADEQGFVTVFRGVPVDLPLGIELYEVNYTSPVPRELVPQRRRTAVLDQSWRSRDEAYDLVRDLERGRLK
jgi:PPM family protein phosphatase